MRKIDERMRYYRYPDGFEHRIEQPTQIHSYYMGDREIHEVTDEKGRLHVIQPGWRILTILPPKTNVERLTEDVLWGSVKEKANA